MTPPLIETAVYSGKSSLKYCTIVCKIDLLLPRDISVQTFLNNFLNDFHILYDYQKVNIIYYIIG